MGLPPDVEPRSLRPVDDTDTPNTNPVGVPPASVAKPDYTPGDPHGVELIDEGPGRPRGFLHASPWDGWPADWGMPVFGKVDELVDTAWAAIDLNSSVFASMPPYLVGASPNLATEWLTNPDPEVYRSWADFAHALMWDYQFCGEVFVVATAHYSTGWPARFHVVPPWTVEVDHAGAGLSYRIGSVELDPRDVLHIRYQATAADTRGHGPLEAGRPRLVAAGVLLRYLTNFVQGGAVPSSVLESPEEVTAKQASDLQAQWVNSRMARMGLPAVLGGGITWKATQVDPLQSALAELAAYTEAKIAILCGVPPLLLGLPSGGDSMTYRNAEGIYDFHWRGGIRLRTSRLLPALSAWLTPRGTSLEVNRDEYVRPGPFERAQTWAIYLEHGVVTVDDVQQAERFTPAASMFELGAT